MQAISSTYCFVCGQAVRFGMGAGNQYHVLLCVQAVRWQFTSSVWRTWWRCAAARNGASGRRPPSLSSAICANHPATSTSRLVGGQPSSRNFPTMQTDRCWACWRLTDVGRAGDRCGAFWRQTDVGRAGDGQMWGGLETDVGQAGDRQMWGRLETDRCGADWRQTDVGQAGDRQMWDGLETDRCGAGWRQTDVGWAGD